MLKGAQALSEEEIKTGNHFRGVKNIVPLKIRFHLEKTADPVEAGKVADIHLQDKKK